MKSLKIVKKMRKPKNLRLIAVSAALLALTGTCTGITAKYANRKNVTESLTIEGTFRYDVTFDANTPEVVGTGVTVSGMPTPNPKDVVYNHPIVLPTGAEVPTCEGYCFLGWAEDGAAESPDYAYAEGAFTPAAKNGIDANVTLYAIWDENTATLTYNDQGGSGGPGSAAMKYTEALQISSTAPAKTGYTFLGWAGSESAAAASYGAGDIYKAACVEPTDSTLYAVWQANRYSVVYHGNGSTGGSMEAGSHTYDASSSLAANGFTRAGWEFIGWNTAENGSGTSYSNGQSVQNLTSVSGGSVELYAQWKRIEYTVSYQAGDATGGTAPASQTKYALEDLTLQANSGSLVHANTTEPLGTRTVTLDGNGGNGQNSVTSTGTKTWTYTPAGWATSAGQAAAAYAFGGTYAAESAVTLYPAWTKSSSDSWTPVSLPNSSKAAATDTRTNGVTFSGNGGSVGTPSATVSRTVNYTFAGWFTDPTGGEQRAAEYTPSKNETLYAHWTEVPGAWSQTTLPSDASRNGYDFAGWYDQESGGNYVGGAGAGVTIEPGKTYYAHWTPHTYTISLNYTEWVRATDSSSKHYDPNATIVSKVGVEITTSTPGQTSTTANVESGVAAITTIPWRRGYVFQGFYTGAHCTGTQIINSAGQYVGGYTGGDVTLYAGWTFSADEYGFSARSYEYCLDRTYDPDYLESHAVRARVDGAYEVGCTIHSDEAERRFANNTQELVRRLYRLILNREVDESGLNTWTNAINDNTKTIDEVAAILATVENDAFARVCASFNLSHGTDFRETRS